MFACYHVSLPFVEMVELSGTRAVVDSTRLDSTQLDSARLGSARLGSDCVDLSFGQVGTESDR